jgi:hypothetical protein
MTKVQCRSELYKPVIYTYNLLLAITKIYILFNYYGYLNCSHCMQTIGVSHNFKHGMSIMKLNCSIYQLSAQRKDERKGNLWE